ncbi:nuclease [bacterium]|nr:nuclease [bacterium]
MAYDNFTHELLLTKSPLGISKDKRKRLLHKADEIIIDKDTYNRTRAQLFDAVREEGTNLLVWLEEAMKILDRAREITQTSKTFFSPENSGQEALKQHLLKANSAVWVCVFTISDNELSDVLIEQHRQGRDIKVLTDNDKIYDRGSDIFGLKEAGVPVKIDETDCHMHHKFAIIDRELLVNGSYNWTRSADEFNHENLIITRDEALVRDFSKEFARLWSSLPWL